MRPYCVRASALIVRRRGRFVHAQLRAGAQEDAQPDAGFNQLAAHLGGAAAFMRLAVVVSFHSVYGGYPKGRHGFESRTAANPYRCRSNFPSVC
jgi:hypothetical protein